MTELPVSRLKFPLVEHFARINQSTINITICFVHRWTVEENLLLSIKICYSDGLIFPPFFVTRLILLQSIEAHQKSEPCQKVKELP